MNNRERLDKPIPVKPPTAHEVTLWEASGQKHTLEEFVWVYRQIPALYAKPTPPMALISHYENWLEGAA